MHYKEFECPLSLILGRKPLNPWNFPSNSRVIVVIHGGPLRSHLIVYANKERQDGGLAMPERQPVCLEGGSFEPDNIRSNLWRG